MRYDYLIVGAGFSGATAARCLADAGKRVLIIDKRDHIGGNAYDYVNEHGVRIHKYGPHIFHTNSDAIFAFLSRFTEWRPYEHRVLASVDGRLVPFPINADTVRELYGLDLDEDGMKAWLAEEVRASWPEGKAVVTAEDQCLSTVGRRLYETFFKGYTTKMWGCDPSELDKSVTARIPVRFNRDDRYFTDKHQAMPRDGYTALFERMLDHPRIGVEIEQSYRIAMPRLSADYMPNVIWTGPIDQYFGERLGPLPYRSLIFLLKHQTPALQRQWPRAATVNNPWDDDDWTRDTNWLRLAGEDDRLAAGEMTREYPIDEGEPYYPVPRPEARALYKRYEAMADAEPNVTFLGRLGTYQYLNMDQAIGQALVASKRLLEAKAA